MANIEGEGIPIPNVLDPPESFEVRLCIPKNAMHVAAFFGALYQLTLWNSWQRNGTNEGKIVADVWWRYFNQWNQSITDLECEDGNMTCCEDVVRIKRIDPETGRMQISTDNGVTWQGDPNDVQNQITLLPPTVGAGMSSTKCDAATNASEHINELITATGENLSTASTVFGLAVAVAEAVLALFLIIVSAGALTAPVTAVATAIWAAATGLFELGIEAYNAYWTTDKQDAILCALYCNIGTNGQFTEVQYQAFRAKIKAQLPASPALDIVMTAINAGGATGLSQMASYGNAAMADCSSCECNCSADLWEIFNGAENYGTVVEYGGDYVICDLSYAPATTGQYFLRMKTITAGTCCEITNIEVISGGATNIAAYADCGTTQTGECPHNIGGSYPTGEANCFVIGSLTASRVKISFQ